MAAKVKSIKGLGAISDKEYRSLKPVAAKVNLTPPQFIRTTVNMKSTPMTKKIK